MNNMVGQRIKKRRKELNITQAQIMEQTSISSGNLSCIENGKYLPSAVALIELSKILQCSIDWILTGESSISNKEMILDIEEHKTVQNRDEQEARLLSYYRAISKPEQEELVSIAKMKSDKEKRMTNDSKDKI